jgi:hypothetical protein
MSGVLKLVKAIIDGFTSALHNYSPCGKDDQLDQVSERVADLPAWEADAARELLQCSRNAVLGPRRLPHIREKDDRMMWSPDDHLLVRGEIIREFCSDDYVTICGRLWR